MNRPQKYTALKVDLPKVSEHLGKLLSLMLGRDIVVRTQCEDDSYWSCAAIGDQFTTTEIMDLIKAVNGDQEMIKCCIPTESNTSRSLDMSLCRALLMRALEIRWDTEFVTKDALWIIQDCADSNEVPEPKSDLIFVNGVLVDTTKLKTKDAFVEKLFRNGGTFKEYFKLVEENLPVCGDYLYWMYPIHDGDCAGAFLTLVQEGVLAISYDAIDKHDCEIFEYDSVRLCTVEDITWFIDNWAKFSKEVVTALGSLRYYLERKEAAA